MLEEPICESLSPLRFVSVTVVVSERDHRKMYKRKRERRQEKRCEQQLRRVDKALSRDGDIPEGSWIYLSHRNLIGRIA